MDNSISGLLNIVALPAPQAGSGSQSQNAPTGSSGNNSGDVQGSQSQPADQAPQPQSRLSDSQNNQANASTGTTSNSGDNSGSTVSHSGNSDFSHLLVASNNNPAPPANALPQGQNNNVADDANSQNTGSNTIISNIIPVILLVQANIPVVNNAGSVQNGAGTAATLSQQDNSLLQQLQQILQQLIQLVNASTQNIQPANAQTQPVTTGDASNTGNQGNGKDNSASGSLAEILSQLLAVLTQINQQPDLQSLSQGLNTLAVTPDGKSAADILAQISQSLENVVGGNANNSSGNNSQSANTASTPFDSILVAFMQSAGTGSNNLFTAPFNGNNTGAQPANPSSDPLNQLQAAVSNIISAFAPAQDGGQGSAGSGSGNGNANDNSQNNNNALLNGQVVPVTVHNAQPLSTFTDFMKLVSAASGTAQASVADQVLVQIKSAADTGNNIIRIQLEPSDLGKVQVQMVTGADGSTGVAVTADNRQTLAMLQNEARALESALRDIGFKTGAGGLSFNLSNQQQAWSGFAGNQQGGYTNVQPVEDVNDEANYGMTIASYQLSVQQGLDIRV